eukprot:GABV01012903.1.p1 GENE.GABV01012903.1~~GABV01012903.1.p1  ORF type:complete len:142 (-),score=40.38 GABV01012903.1:3-386(-)
MSNDTMTVVLIFLPLHSRLALRTASEAFHVWLDCLHLTQTTLAVTLRLPTVFDPADVAKTLLETVQICSKFVNIRDFFPRLCDIDVDGFAYSTEEWLQIAQYLSFVYKIGDKDRPMPLNQPPPALDA